MLLDRALIEALIEYRPATGRFHWLVERRGYHGGVKPGDIAGTLKDGYIQIIIDQRIYAAHRLAWFLMTGAFPPKGREIDHINRNRADNRWENLRLVTRSQNNMNAGLRSDNKSGQKGVGRRKDTGKWYARVTVQRRIILLGHFGSYDEAVAARRAAERRYFGQFAAA